MLIHVAQKHIDEGIAFDCSKCPVALALQEATGVEWFVSGSMMCHKTTCMSIFGGWSEDNETPVDVGDKIRQFDVDGTMQPFSFELEYKK